MQTHGTPTAPEEPSCRLSWRAFPLCFPPKVLLLFGELALLTLSTWSYISTKWKNSIIFMPDFQTAGEPTFPYHNVTWEEISHVWNYRMVIELKQMKLTRCFSPGNRAGGRQKENPQNLIKALTPRRIYSCKADFHVNWEPQESFTAQDGSIS